MRSYRPISNLPVLSKLLERTVAKQFLDYLKSSDLLPDLQSVYRAHHFTETAIRKIQSDILQAIDAGDLAALMLLDMSAAFDTVDHSTLLRRLRVSYGLQGAALGWFTSFLSGRTQFVNCRSTRSLPTMILGGVPQGAILSPIRFLLYITNLLQIIAWHNLRPHMYADDIQIYGLCSPSTSSSLQEQISTCIDDVVIWLRFNRS